MKTRSHPKEVISSRNHPAAKRARALHQRAERDSQRRFLIEGARFLAAAIESRAPLDSIFYAPGLLQPFAKRLVVGQHHRGVPCLPVSPEVLHSLAQNDDPQGVIAVARQKWTPLHEARPDAGLCWLALEEVQSAGNLGTMIRTSEAVGAAGLILLGDSPDPYASACTRASMGALFSQRFVHASLAEFAAWKKRHGCRLVGTSPAASSHYDEAVYDGPLALFMGWERQGLSGAAMAACDELVRIPMAGKSDSLNVAVAAGVMLYEVLRQKRAAQVLEALSPRS